ncbi:MAG TPA: 4-hydroxy-tetrahydrodipicolinate reductase [Dehalococcoidia bacterium]|nr:4-hydroxy-tetrahydrodipicolinate reductase [Dehalococcoidia bacterium]
MTIRVMISGSGKMGQEVLRAVAAEADLEPVAVVDLFATEDHIPLPDGTGTVPCGTSAAALIARTNPDVIVDFTNADWTPKLAHEASEAGVRLVIGTTGLSEDFTAELSGECARKGIGAVLAPNFALGAVLMQHMARLAARYYENAEIIEMHHDRKVDAPSGTSLATARGMAEAREGPFTRPPTHKQTLPGTRGGETGGITIHSVRLPGLVAHQEVIFGGRGETLTIRHDSMGRESFMPGVVLAIREVMERKELVVGLEALLGLS